METIVYSGQKKLVVIVIMPGVQLLDAVGPSDVFSYTSHLVMSKLAFDSGYEVIMASATKSRQITANSGVSITCAITVAEIRSPIDTLIITGGYALTTLAQIPMHFFNWLNNVYPTVRRVASVCTGAFALAEAGILDNKSATTHWDYCPKLREEYPAVKVSDNPFFIRDGKVYTSGGVSSGMDLALALVEEDFGRDIALQVARKLVLQLKRPGNQSQFSTLLPDFQLKSKLIRDLRQWLLENIHNKDINVGQMAEKVNMSPRNFARVFIKDANLTPAKFLEKLRVEMARKYLEDTHLSMEQIAEKCGLAGMGALRRLFLRHLEISPNAYRSGFKTTQEEVK
jgi:transcriptional regulator GlxA family with amidase domain